MSIIIVSWNTKTLLKQCLLSINTTKPDVCSEIIVVDNNSWDGSADMVQKEFQSVRLIKSAKNVGFAKANNLAIRITSGPYVCLINSDIKVMKGCLQGLFSFMDEHPEVALVGPRILNPDMTVQPSCYASPTLWNSFTTALGVNKITYGNKLIVGFYEKYWPYMKSQTVEALSGCFMLVRRKAMDQVGLLDEDFFFGWEDFDWCKRFRMSGWEVVYLTKAEAIHHHYASSSISPAKAAVESVRGQLHYWKKYYGSGGMIYAAIMVLLRNVLQLVKCAILFPLRRDLRGNLKIKIKKNLAVVEWMFGVRSL